MPLTMLKQAYKDVELGVRKFVICSEFDLPSPFTHDLIPYAIEIGVAVKRFPRLGSL
ncbi:MAG: hypothetical protein H3Z53_06760 [archaeon]|nr:hypothetical protein [archaeon]